MVAVPEQQLMFLVIDVTRHCPSISDIFWKSIKVEGGQCPGCSKEILTQLGTGIEKFAEGISQNTSLSY